MAIGDYDLVVIGDGARAKAIALKASKLKARVAFVTTGNIWDRDRIEQIISQVNSAPESLVQILNSLQSLESLGEDLEFLQSSGIDVILGNGQFSDRHTFVINSNSSENPSENLKCGRKLKSRRFVIVRDLIPPVRKIMGLNEVDYLTYDSLFNLLETSIESLTSLTASITILGGNALNCAIAQLLNNLGIKVQILAENRILPEFDIDSARILQTQLELQGIKIWTGYIVTAVSDRKIWVNMRSGTETMAVDGKILISAFSNAPDLNFSKAGIRIKDGEIIVNSKLQTANPHIYLYSQAQDIDVILKNSLFLPIASTKSLIPTHICLTAPVVASIGLSEIDARLHFGQDLYVVQSYTQRDDLEFHKVLYRGNGEIVGAHFVGNHAQELMASMAIIMNQKLNISDIKGVGVVSELCQEIASNILIKRQRSLWFKLFNW
jgi:pyruvate/2-oxoglutarate dehydrogenase complex dihydrolipoamide dehydrogenase (E3) component